MLSSQWIVNLHCHSWHQQLTWSLRWLSARPSSPRCGQRRRRGQQLSGPTSPGTGPGQTPGSAPGRGGGGDGTGEGGGGERRGREEEGGREVEVSWLQATSCAWISNIFSITTEQQRQLHIYSHFPMCRLSLVAYRKQCSLVPWQAYPGDEAVVILNVRLAS